MRSLFTNADILTFENDWRVIEKGYLGIENDRIIYLGENKPEGVFDAVRDFSGHALIPGLYNLHSHTPMSLLRGLGSGLPLDRWLFEQMLPVERRMTPGHLSVGNRIAMMEMLASGVVSFSDMYHHPSSYAADVVASGMRANLGHPTMEMLNDDPAARAARIQESIDFFDQWHGCAEGRLLADFAIHAEYTTSAESVRRYTELCKERRARLQVHISETLKEHQECKQRHGKTPVRFFYDLDVFDNPTCAAHCVAVEPEDMDLLKEKDVTVVHNPSSNMKLGSGFMPIAEMRKRGIRITLGTDGDASNNNQNLFEEMHLAAMIHSGYMQDPTLLPVGDLFKMATIDGATAQGRADCGNLAVDMKADVVAIDLDSPHLMPNHDLLSLLVYSAQASDVVMTMVDGKVLYDNREFLTIDKDRVRHDLNDAMKTLF